MRALEETGIYLILDLSSSESSIVRNNPQYDINIWSKVRNTVDAFKGYSNTLGFIVGNEVTNDSKTTPASAYVKALLRDTKAYIRSSAPRLIPVGYANNDDPEIRLQVQAYFNCGPNEERADFFGINLYEWCGDNTTYQTSGYVDRTADIASYSIPVFLSEYGCNVVSPRAFHEVKSIFGLDMTSTWSGGIVYEWSQQENNYGLVQINTDNSVTLLPDFQALKGAMSSIHPAGVNMDLYYEQRPHSACPAITATWEPSANLPLHPSSETCDCMMSSLVCVASEQALSTSDKLGKEFDTLCSMTNCEHIDTDSKTGVHGKYSFCSPTQKLAFLYNQYYSSTGQSQPSACHFNGMAKLSTPARLSDEGCAAPQGIQTKSFTKRAAPHASDAVSHQEKPALGLTAIAALAAFI
jgi:hypothetical protein